MGTTPLAPMAVMARAAVKAPTESIAAVAAVSTTKAVIDPRMITRRPSRSESGPHTSVIIP
jgi:hypothetical protein